MLHLLSTTENNAHTGIHKYDTDKNQKDLMACSFEIWNYCHLCLTTLKDENIFEIPVLMFISIY